MQYYSLAGWCRLVPTGFLRSRGTQGIPPGHRAYVYRPITFCGAAFQSASSLLGFRLWALQPPAHKWGGFGLTPVRSPLLGESLYCFLLLGVLRCFSSPRLTSPEYSGDTSDKSEVGCPIRTPADPRSCAAPRSFSQLYTSFIARICQGIHHTPFYVYTVWLAMQATNAMTLNSNLCSCARQVAGTG